MYRLSPSVLSADFAKLGQEVKTVEKAGAHYIHLDVMDGVFVPSITIGMPVIKSIRKESNIIFDVHLMVMEPIRYIKQFVEAGADIITIHQEACYDIPTTIKAIRKLGCKAGITLKPNTSLQAIVPYLELVDMVLIMCVEPGFGGQKYMEESTARIRELKRIIDEKKLDIDIEVDGGINHHNVDVVLEAGANVIVAGSAVFKNNTEDRIKRFLEIFKKYE